MKISTEYLGEIEFDETEIITMEKGVIGFEDYHKYILVNHPEPEMPYMWYQSVEDTKVYFIVTNPFYFVENYDFDLRDSVVERLEIKEIEDILTLSLVVIPEKVKDTTLNLQSPIIVNKRIGISEQVILEETFPLKHKIFAEGKVD